MRDDLISRQAAIDAVAEGLKRTFVEYRDVAEKMLNKVPSAQPEVKEIGYAECANAMLKMWIDNVLTDGEYNRIMDKLNTHYDAENDTCTSEGACGDSNKENFQNRKYREITL